ncbi:MAG TPA: YaiO family outer membrane beta-barrel protein [Gammaproteobacteria bacterium]|nr:YaiO family outer membrane beta-barrel protein [Gammaproteobacteria bacterium]
MSPRALRAGIAAAALLFSVHLVHAEGALDDEIAAAVAAEDYSRAANLLEGKLAGAPADAAARFMLARVRAWSGDYASALADYDRLLEAHPEDVDYVFGRAQALAWAGRGRDALAELDRARILAPGYEDVWRLELALLERRASADASRSERNAAGARLAAFRAEAGARFPQAEWWQPVVPATPAPARASPPTELTVGASQDSLSTEVPDWTSVFVQVTRQRGGRGAVRGALRKEARFGDAAWIVGGGADWRATPGWTMGVDLDLAGSDAGFVPRFAAEARALRSLGSGWETELRLRERRYSESDVATAGATVARYFSSFRLAYSLDESQLDGGAGSAAHSARLSWYRTERTELDFTAVLGQEAEAIAPGRVLRTRVRGFSIGGRHALDDRLKLSWWAGTQRQGSLYYRRYVGVSLAAGL